MIRTWIVALLLAFFAAACASSPEPPPPPEPVVEAPKPPPPPPARAPEPEPAPVVTRVLPKTASPIPAIGLTGIGALIGAGALRHARRRLLG
jgi:hypothetical protein